MYTVRAITTTDENCQLRGTEDVTEESSQENSLVVLLLDIVVQQKFEYMVFILCRPGNTGSGGWHLWSSTSNCSGRHIDHGLHKI